MQLARAEGGRLRMDRSADLRAVARVVVDDLGRAGAPSRIALKLSETPVMSDIDPDAFGILCRNLIENALRHGAETAPVDVTLTSEGQLIVANDGPTLSRETLDRLTARFERASEATDGSGLGLAIVAAIAERLGSPLTLKSPRSNGASGFEVTLALPVEGSGGSNRNGAIVH